MPNPDIPTPALELTDGTTVIASGNWQVYALTQPGVRRVTQELDAMEVFLDEPTTRWTMPPAQLFSQRLKARIGQTGLE